MLSGMGLLFFCGCLRVEEEITLKKSGAGAFRVHVVVSAAVWQFLQYSPAAQRWYEPAKGKAFLTEGGDISVTRYQVRTYQGNHELLVEGHFRSLNSNVIQKLLPGAQLRHQGSAGVLTIPWQPLPLEQAKEQQAKGARWVFRFIAPRKLRVPKGASVKQQRIGEIDLLKLSLADHPPSELVLEYE